MRVTGFWLSERPQKRDYMKPPVKIPDIVIILLALGLTGYSAFVAYMHPRNMPRVLIQGPTQRWIFPLDAEETVRVRGVLGNDTVIRIHANEVWVESSPCDNKTCVGMGHISVNSLWNWVACLPNNVFFVIEGSDDGGDFIDGVAW